MEPNIFKFIKNDKTFLEKEPLTKLGSKNKLNAFKHNGFWQCMDTLKEKEYLDAGLIARVCYSLEVELNKL